MDLDEQEEDDGMFEDEEAAVEEPTLLIRNALSRDTINLDEEDPIDAPIDVDDEEEEVRNGFFLDASAFKKLSRENQTVENVVLRIPWTLADDVSRKERYAIWDEIAEGVGNLEALGMITITMGEEEPEDNEGALALDWEILGCILRRLRRGVMLSIYDENASPLQWDTDGFAGVILEQAMITGFSTEEGFPVHRLDILCSALLTLPALVSVSFNCDGQAPEEGQSLQSMVQLLQSPILRKVRFERVDFTQALCQAVATALNFKRSEITSLSVACCCFPMMGGSAPIARALMNNTKLKRLAFKFIGGGNLGFHEVLASVLLSNSTLQKLELLILDKSGRCQWLLPLFLALQMNVGLKELSLHGSFLIDEKLSTAMRLGLGNNSTLESLSLMNIKSNGNDTCLWREAFSFLRTNTALKTLYMAFDYGVTESYVTAIRMEVAAMLLENESLETLSMMSSDASFQDYLVFLSAIQPNTTLKSLQLSYLKQHVTKELFRVLKKNYGLEDIRGLRIARDIHSIFDLNRAGRRYLVQDGSSISKGVDVLSRVSNDTNSVFLHLLENPRLCDRSAIETASIGNIDNARLTSPGNRHSGGKQRESQVPHNLVQGSVRVPLSAIPN
jgi:hypothetical protein